MRMDTGLPAVVGIVAAGLAVALSASAGAPARPEGAAVPERLAGYSHLTGNVSSSPPGPAVALYQHGYGVELLDFPQAVVLGAGGDVYRRLDAAEGRAGAETQGDPAPMLLSPDGTRVAVGDHDTDRPDVVIVDLLTGEATTHPLPSGRSVLPVAWSRDGGTLAHLLSPEATNPYTGERIAGQVGLLDLDDDTAVVLPDTDVTAVAFSPDGAQLAVEQADTDSVAEARLRVVDLASGAERDLEADGVLAGPAAWSPDGRLIATTTLEPSGAPVGVPDPGTPSGLAFADPTGAGGDVPAPLELPLAGPGRVLGWTAGEVVTLLDVEGYDPCCGPEAYTVSRVPVDGAEPATLMRVDDLARYGVGRFQMASSLTEDLAVVDPDDVDRGPWPLPFRVGLALGVGLVAWLAARLAARRMLRRRPGAVTEPGG